MDDNPNPPADETGPDAGRFGRAREYAGQAKDFAGQKYQQATNAMRDGYNNVREKVEDVDFDAVADQVRTYVRSNPGKALLISVGVGFLIGLLLRRDEE